MNVLARLFYRLHLLFTSKPSKNGLHPDYKRLVSFAFSIPQPNGKPVDYYCFNTAADMPTARFSKWNEFLEDYNRRFDNDELKDVVTEIIDSLNKNSVEGVTNAVILSRYILERTSIAMDVDLFLRFCSVTYFTLDEDLLTYDWDVGTAKIEQWKQSGIQGFFLNEPVKKWLPSTSLSSRDLDILTAQKKEMLRIFKRQSVGESK